MKGCFEIKTGCVYYPFSAVDYPFHTLVEELFDVSDLSRLHYISPEKYTKLFEVGSDSSTAFHKKFYDKLRSGWVDMELMYEQFIKYVIAHNIDGDFLYQKFPTFRVHLPGNVAVGRFHKDAEFGHPKGEKNFIIPLTFSNGTDSIWVESECNKGDYEPMELYVGELIYFNGNELTHGNKVNEEEKTRVSMDFRVLPLSEYILGGTAEASVTQKQKFVEGEYYKLFKQ